MLDVSANQMSNANTYYSVCNALHRVSPSANRWQAHITIDPRGVTTPSTTHDYRDQSIKATQPQCRLPLSSHGNLQLEIKASALDNKLTSSQAVKASSSDNSAAISMTTTEHHTCVATNDGRERLDNLPRLRSPAAPAILALWYTTSLTPIMEPVREQQYMRFATASNAPKTASVKKSDTFG